MLRTKLLGMAFLTVFMAASVSCAFSEDDKPAYTIKEVMKAAEGGKDSLQKKLVAGTATKEEKEKLIEYLTALSKNTPPKGDAKEWKTKTEALLAAAKEAIKDEKAVEKFSKANKCADCHSVFKGK